MELLEKYWDTTDIQGMPFSRFFKHTILGYKG